MKFWRGARRAARRNHEAPDLPLTASAYREGVRDSKLQAARIAEEALREAQGRDHAIKQKRPQRDER